MAEPTYSYDPTLAQDGGLNQMRFELGDTVLDLGPITSPLCDEEYNAILAKHGKWRTAKIRCLEAIVMKLAYEVNTSLDGLSYSLNDRYNRWRKMLDDEKKAASLLANAPRAGDPTSLSPHGGTPYFYNDMLTNPRKHRGW